MTNPRRTAKIRQVTANSITIKMPLVVGDESEKFLHALPVRATMTTG